MIGISLDHRIAGEHSIAQPPRLTIKARQHQPRLRVTGRLPQELLQKRGRSRNILCRQRIGDRIVEG
jgi:hypothetical protein